MLICAHDELGISLLVRGTNIQGFMLLLRGPVPSGYHLGLLVLQCLNGGYCTYIVWTHLLLVIID